MQKFAPDVLKIVVWEFEHQVLFGCRAFGIEAIISNKAQIVNYENFSYLSSSCSITVKPLLVSSPISGKLNFGEKSFCPIAHLEVSVRRSTAVDFTTFWK